jgi:hypothetical protein
MKNILTRNWHLMRIIRLVLGGFIVYDGLRSHEYLFVFFGGAFMYMALFNLGCCGPQGCAVTPINDNKSDMESEVQFEEVKNKKGYNE